MCVWAYVCLCETLLGSWPCPGSCQPDLQAEDAGWTPGHHTSALDHHCAVVLVLFRLLSERLQQKTSSQRWASVVRRWPNAETTSSAWLSPDAVKADTPAHTQDTVGDSYCSSPSEAGTVMQNLHCKVGGGGTQPYKTWKTVTYTYWYGCTEEDVILKNQVNWCESGSHIRLYLPLYIFFVIVC